ncbi:MAG: DUF2333 family protein [Deltaproteobacteria bacterium]|nr:DUF2333 family protein [Deltaproteobacteria bacterium]
MTPKRDNEHLPVPVKPSGPSSTPPVESLLVRLLRYRFFLVALVIVLFFVALSAWQAMFKSKPALEAQAPLASLTHEEGPATGKEAEPLLVPPPAPEAKGPEAAPQPAPAVPHAPGPLTAAPRELAKGEGFTRALIKIMDDQVNGTWLGWRPNSILFGKLGLTDNVNNIQLGVLEVARRTIVVMNENMTRFATTEAYNPQVNEAMNYFMVSPDKYWFPSASGKYREATHDLEIYIDGLHKGRSRFYSRVDNLIALLGNYKDLLGSSFHNLIKDNEADGKAVSWWVSDDYFYFSRGIALGMAEMLDAVSKEFDQELQKKNSHKLLEEASHALHQAAHLSPWLVTNGDKDGWIANHRANMGTYIGEAEHLISTLQMMLATN